MSNITAVQDNEVNSDNPALPAVQDNLPTGSNTDIVPVRSELLGRILIDAEGMSREVQNVATLMAQAAVKQYGTDISYKVAAKETLHHRRMFQAKESIRKLVGEEDVPDISGSSEEYRASMREVNKAARIALIDGILAETPDLSEKAAEMTATALMKQFDQNMKRELRILVDREFRAMGAEGARIMLCYGFRHTSVIKGTQTIPENWNLKEGSDRKLLVPAVLDIPKPKPILVQGDTEQVKAGETANKVNEAEKDEIVANGGDVANPLDLINRAEVLLRDALALMEQKDFNFPKGSTLRNRQQTRTQLFATVKKVGSHLVPDPDKTDK
jgi:hypothetical protein